MRTAVGNSVAVTLWIASAAVVTVLICLNRSSNFTCKLKQTIIIVNNYSPRLRVASQHYLPIRERSLIIYGFISRLVDFLLFWGELDLPVVFIQPIFELHGAKSFLNNQELLCRSTNSLLIWDPNFHCCVCKSLQQFAVLCKTGAFTCLYTNLCVRFLLLASPLFLVLPTSLFLLRISHQHFICFPRGFHVPHTCFISTSFVWSP
jgi:hypothetical protein